MGSRARTLRRQAEKPLSLPAPKAAAPGRLNQYTCRTCGGTITTIDRHEGVTPWSLNCRATEGCDGVMQSHIYRGVDPNTTPEWEWFKPRKLPKGPMYEHVKMGGLDLRRIED